MARASRSIEIDVPPEAFFRVVQDYGRYPEFVPEVKSVRVGPRVGAAVEVTYWLDVRVQLFDFTLRHEARGPQRIEWQLVRGSEFMRGNRGAWTLERTAAGLTRATYAIDLDLGPMVPANFEKALAERGLPNMLANFKARAEQLAR
jgi:ribosome-associated toxin RatA of RatAB toxin-antitoxin module